MGRAFESRRNRKYKTQLICFSMNCVFLLHYFLRLIYSRRLNCPIFRQPHLVNKLSEQKKFAFRSITSYIVLWYRSASFINFLFRGLYYKQTIECWLSWGRELNQIWKACLACPLATGEPGLFYYKNPGFLLPG
jgi:hypothetical protein